MLSHSYFDAPRCPIPEGTSTSTHTMKGDPATPRVLTKPLGRRTPHFVTPHAHNLASIAPPPIWRFPGIQTAVLRRPLQAASTPAPLSRCAVTRDAVQVNIVFANVAPFATRVIFSFQFSYWGKYLIDRHHVTQEHFFPRCVTQINEIRPKSVYIFQVHFAQCSQSNKSFPATVTANHRNKSQH